MNTPIFHLPNHSYFRSHTRVKTFDNTTDEDSDASPPPEMSMPRSVRFWLLLAFDIPAIACTLFILYHLLIHRSLRSALNNHVIILFLFSALISQLIDIPAYMVYASLGYVWPATPKFCQLWWFINVGIFLITSMLMAYASMERHVLVFYDKLVSTHKKRIMFHYIPLGCILLYGFIYYIKIIFFPSCEQTYDYSQAWCSYPCYFDQPVLSMFDSLFNSILSILLTSVFSIALLIRVVYRKIRSQRRVRWRKHRNMAIQLLSIATLYLIIVLPVPCFICAHLLGVPADFAVQVQLYTYFLCYFIPLLLPYVILGSFRNLQKKIRRIRPNTIALRENQTRTIVASFNQRVQHCQLEIIPASLKHNSQPRVVQVESN